MYLLTYLFVRKVRVQVAVHVSFYNLYAWLWKSKTIRESFSHVNVWIVSPAENLFQLFQLAACERRATALRLLRSGLDDLSSPGEGRRPLPDVTRLRAIHVHEWTTSGDVMTTWHYLYETNGIEVHAVDNCNGLSVMYWNLIYKNVQVWLNNNHLSCITILKICVLGSLTNIHF